MANNVESQLISRIRENSFYCLQIDETTDVSNEVQLHCYVRYEFSNDIHEDMLFSNSLPIVQLENIFLKLLMSVNILFRSMKLIGNDSCAFVRTLLVGSQVGRRRCS